MKQNQKTPVIGITLGDPGGVGPEVVAAALRRFPASKSGVQLRVLGSKAGVAPGKLTKRSAQYAIDALLESVDLLRRGEIQAVVNAPVSKENLSRVGFRHPGQTEFYAEAFGLGPEEVTMSMQSDKLRVFLVSTHCSLKEAIRRLDADGICLHAGHALDVLKKMGIRRPRIAVCGLNPHAGEHGLFGDEEERFIEPAVLRLRKKFGPLFHGPFSPDTVFGHALSGKYDGVLCHYHDQGLIPFKLVAFEDGVNLTLGLPFWRSSPDHGTALDIAGKGLASCKSFLAALRLTAALARKPAI
ncbi:MAG: 4-hydroxythreonine-4-phosphate dehydrogenase PdxA [Methylacidiphilales bacterium]|nr:4-hydroxythreonine-4-phosphate dehydrogenase PdxA [Candidatus Methylacidiphilales bacterium]